MTDDEIIKKRLLIDGDGTGDDRRLNMILKQYLKWTLNKNETPENSQVIYDRLLAQLAQCEFAASKSEFTLKMIEDELGNYAKLSEAIDRSIEFAKKDIEDTKKELVIAKEVRKNKMEYDLLAKKIKEQPDRKETNVKIANVQKDLNGLTLKKAKVERKLQKRRNDFTLLMQTMQQLSSQLYNENTSESSDSDKDDDEAAMEELSDDELPLAEVRSNRDAETAPTSAKTDRLAKSETPSDGTSKDLTSVDEDTVQDGSNENSEKEMKMDTNEAP